jgi:O-6-methylguanine DNA methyltransferase
MLALASDTALCALEFDTGGRLTRLDARLARFFPEAVVEDGENGVTLQTREWLDAYFAGRAADANALPLDGRGTPFEMTVWSALRRIPPGATTSYGAIAAKLASIAASRAVGLANGANPIAIIVPCHRVIGADGSLTGYGGGLDRKTWLLDHERRHWPTTSSYHAPEQTFLNF